MTPNCDSRTLYNLCTSRDLAERREGFRRLGACLLPVARNQLNETYFDLTVVQDCVQVVLEIIWEKVSRGQGPQSPDAFFAFAVQITRHRCIDRYRYERRRTTEPLDGEDEDGIQHTAALGIAPEQSPEEQVLRHDALLLLIRHLQDHADLSDNAKIVLIQGFFFEKTDAEVADMLATSEPNVRLIRHRALKRLQDDEGFISSLRDG